MTGVTRRDLITSTALVLVGDRLARAGIIQWELPWIPGTEAIPDRVHPGPWRYFTAAETTTYDQPSSNRRHRDVSARAADLSAIEPCSLKFAVCPTRSPAPP
jgi:hypothetical protein